MNDTSLRTELLSWADVLARGTGSVPAVDVAWKLRQIAGATPTTGPAPAAADGQRFYVERHENHDDPFFSGWKVMDRDGQFLPVVHVTREQAEEAADEAEHRFGRPAVPQAPAQPTECKEPADSVQSDTEIESEWRADAVDPDAFGPAGYLLRPPTAGPATREDTAPLDDYGDDVRVPGPLAPVTAPVSHWQDSEGSIWEEGDDGRLRLFEHRGERLTFHRPWCGRDEVTTLFGELSPLRPSAPPVDGDTPTAPTSEEA